MAVRYVRRRSRRQADAQDPEPGGGGTVATSARPVQTAVPGCHLDESQDVVTQPSAPPPARLRPLEALTSHRTPRCKSLGQALWRHNLANPWAGSTCRVEVWVQLIPGKGEDRPPTGRRTVTAVTAGRLPPPTGQVQTAEQRCPRTGRRGQNVSSLGRWAQSRRGSQGPGVTRVAEDAKPSNTEPEPKSHTVWLQHRPEVSPEPAGWK